MNKQEFGKNPKLTCNYRLNSQGTFNGFIGKKDEIRFVLTHNTPLIVDIATDPILKFTLQSFISRKLPPEFRDAPNNTLTCYVSEAFTYMLNQLWREHDFGSRCDWFRRENQRLFLKEIEEYIQQIIVYAENLGISLCSKQTILCNCCNQAIKEKPIEDRWGGYICTSCNNSEI